MDLYCEYLYIPFSIPLVGGIAYGSTIPIGHTTPSRSIKEGYKRKMRRPYLERLMLFRLYCLDHVVLELELEFEFHSYIVRTAACCFSRIVFTIEDILHADLQSSFFGYFVIYRSIC